MTFSGVNNGRPSRRKSDW